MTKADSDGPWPIDVEKLRQSPLELEATVEELSQDDARVRNWNESLKSLVDIGASTHPGEWMPGVMFSPILLMAASM
ncbi:MAG: hypothetical protein KJP19_09865, partial [Deltaproteobacteria bacterium]|nr:hypothetical protein [Deltaproteobacteria bacterium]